jgi:hypothetical protein
LLGRRAGQARKNGCLKCHELAWISHFLKDFSRLRINSEDRSSVRSTQRTRFVDLRLYGEVFPNPTQAMAAMLNLDQLDPGGALWCAPEQDGQA